MCADGLLSKTRLAEHLTKLSGKQAELQSELAKCHASIAPTFDAKQLAALFEQFVGWDTRTREERRSILAVTIPRLRIESGEVVEFYRLLDSKKVQVAANDRATPRRDLASSSKQSKIHRVYRFVRRFSPVPV
jgi:hypothetical protein